MQFLYVYVIAFCIFALLDFVVMRIVMRHLYRSYIGHLQGSLRWGALVFFYAVFLLGLSFFAINPSVTTEAPWYAVILGGFFGFFSYTTYALNNYASLKHWPFALVVIDVVWGTLVGASVAGLTYLAVSLVL